MEESLEQKNEHDAHPRWIAFVRRKGGYHWTAMVGGVIAFL